MSELKGKQVAITGKFDSASRGDLSTRLKAAGAKVGGLVGRKTELLIVGHNAGRKLRDALAAGIEVWQEGDLLEALGESSGSSEPPSSRALAGIEPEAEGTLRIELGPEMTIELDKKSRWYKVEERLGVITVHWRRVPFTTSRKFAETWGPLLERGSSPPFKGQQKPRRTQAGLHYVGRLELDGTPLSVSSESFRYCRFTEAGDDYEEDEQSIEPSEDMLNVTPFVDQLNACGYAKMKVTAESLEFEASGEAGAVLGGYETYTYRFGSDRKSVSFHHHWAPIDASGVDADGQSVPWTKSGRD